MLLKLITLALLLQSAGFTAIVGGGFVFHLRFGGVGISSEETGVSRAREMDGKRLKRATTHFGFAGRVGSRFWRKFGRCLGGHGLL